MLTGIIAEYDPFHRGHKYHIEKTRELTGGDIAVIMSGSFVQRGEPAVYNKYVRTRAALLNGADMVMELPVQYATGAADVFAFGAVSILERSNIFDCLSFGSESADINALEKTAEILADEPEELKILIKKYSAEGMSYPKARGRALNEYAGIEGALLESPNDILALEYIKQLKINGSNIRPIAVKRLGSGYSSADMEREFPSAMAIRAELTRDKKKALSAVPENCREIFENEKITRLDDFSSMLMYKLITAERAELSDIADITEGLENRILGFGFGSITELAEGIKTRRYTRLKIQRALLHILLDIKKEAQKTPPEYIRVLGFRRGKENMISELADKAELPVILNVKENEDMLRAEITASDIYNAINGGKKGEEYKTGVVVV